VRILGVESGSINGKDRDPLQLGSVCAEWCKDNDPAEHGSAPRCWLVTKIRPGGAGQTDDCAWAELRIPDLFVC